MSEPFCSDCPDREGCSSGYPCHFVKQVHFLTSDEMALAYKLEQLGMSTEESVQFVYTVAHGAFVRGYETAQVDYLHPDFGIIWDPPLPDGKGGMTEGGQVWVALREREAELAELAKEVARWHPSCVMPQSYGSSMYGLAQAAVALITALGVNENEVAKEDEETIDD